MDEGGRFLSSNGSPSVGVPSSKDTSAEVCHRTPVQMKHGDAHPSAQNQNQNQIDSRTKQWAKSLPANQTEPVCLPGPQDSEVLVSDRSGSTIQRQRRELQLLIAELKDRDRELNAMAATHHKHLHAWEQDRQRALALEQRCARLNDELQRRNDVIIALTKRAWGMETRDKDVQKELGTARQQLCELEQNQDHISKKCKDFEEKNQSLNSSVMVLSSQVGSLQVREEELDSMLKLKDKDAAEASGQVVEMTGRLQDLEESLVQSRSQETRLLREVEENRRRYRDTKQEVSHLKEELQQHLTQSSSQREEMIRLKQELQLLHRDLVFSGEGESWKDELLELARSKQERTMTELLCLRQVCENQRNDLQLLQMNLEGAHESLREKNSKGLPESQDKLRCVCLDKPSLSSLRVKNLRLLQDSLPAVFPPGSVRDELGVFLGQAPGVRPEALNTSAMFPWRELGKKMDITHVSQGDDCLSSCSLQQLLDESRRIVDTSTPNSSILLNSVSDCGASESLPCHHLLHHLFRHHPDAPSEKANETPPTDGPRNQPDMWRK